MSKPDTRTRILVATLTLFNEQGEPNTTTNEIADEVDISPGNLHYHFRKKSDLVDALLLEFQADAQRVLQPPNVPTATFEDFCAFLQLLLELLAAYRFLLRDMETLVATYPKVQKALNGFSKALLGVMQIYVKALRENRMLDIDESNIGLVCRNLVVVALFSERFDEIGGDQVTPDISAMRVARSLLGVISPYSIEDGKLMIAELMRHYH